MDKVEGFLKAMENSPEMRQFIEMCFEPNSPMNDKLKQALFMMIEGDGENERE